MKWEVIEAQIVETDACIEWQGRRHHQGYGRVWFEGRETLVHRMVYAKVHGKKLTPRQHVCHQCDNPTCINPRHLWLGDALLNMRDMSQKKRGNFQQKDTCKHGHPYDGRVARQRTCSVCARIAQKKYRDRLKEER